MDGFALDDESAECLHSIFRAYVDKEPSGLMGMGQFITMVCDARLDTFFAPGDQKNVFESSGGRLDFPSFLQTLGALATARYPKEKYFSTAMDRLLKQHIMPLKQPATIDPSHILSEPNHTRADITGVDLREAITQKPTFRKIEATLVPVLKGSSLFHERSNDGLREMVFHFPCVEGKQEDSFTLSALVFEPLRRTFAFYSSHAGSAMRGVPTFCEIQRHTVVEKMELHDFYSLLEDCHLLGSSTTARGEAASRKFSMTKSDASSIFNFVLFNKAPEQRKNLPSGEFYDSLRDILEPNHTVQSKYSKGGAFTFLQFLSALAQIAIHFEVHESAENDLSWRGKFPLSIDSVVKDHILTFGYRREPVLARLRVSAILNGTHDDVRADPFVMDLLRRQNIRQGMRALYFHFASQHDVNRHRYTEAKSRSGSLASSLPAETGRVKSIKYWAKIWMQIDGDGDGKLNLNQMCLALKRLSQPLNFFHVEDWIVRVGEPTGQELGVSFQCFAAAWGTRFDLDNSMPDNCESLGLLDPYLNSCSCPVRNRFEGVTIHRALEFAKAFDICPELLSEAECRSIYTKVAMIKPEPPYPEQSFSRFPSSENIGPWNLSATECSISVDCERFVTFVCFISQAALGKYPFNKCESSASEKLLLLLNRIEFSKSGKQALAIKGNANIFGDLPAYPTITADAKKMERRRRRQTIDRTLGVRPGAWENLTKTKAERAMWASLAAARTPKRNVSSPSPVSPKASSEEPVYIPRRAKKSSSMRTKGLSKRVTASTSANERRQRGLNWSAKGYSLDSVSFKKLSADSSEADESMYYNRGTYMGRHWRVNKSRTRPAENRHRFVKSLTSHGLRSSGSRKDARNATVKRETVKRETVKDNERGDYHNTTEAVESVDVVTEPALSLESPVREVDPPWDDEVAGELAKLRAELHQATNFA